ncbi:MAG: adenylate/guanylate cyclase domain-containing protein [Alphaproteobacteria bacterium]|nr:adenylate/guanylate cyclase domain-containing protein [Alphaproteobacteria bacterium]
MRTYRPNKEKDFSKIVFEGKSYSALNQKIFDGFNPSLLDLGEIKKKSSRKFGAIAAFLDLQGFTTFCSQMDPHLVISEFTEEFLAFIFETIKNEFVMKKTDSGPILWCSLPFFVKFLGDGLLVLWETTGMTTHSIENLVVTMEDVCNNYRNKFIPSMKKKMVEIPPTLRCGIARGEVMSIGDDKDFVGPCINMAARLQKLFGLNFVVARRGIDISEENMERFDIKSVTIRGIGSNELVYVKKNELKSLSKEDASQFRDP